MNSALRGCLLAVPDGGRVLDVGCLGFRQVSDATLLGRALRHAGVDRLPAPATIPPGFDYRVADIDEQPIPFEDDTFDLVIASHVIEHLHHPIEAVAECVRVCRPGGTIYIEAPSERALWMPGMPGWHDDNRSLSFFDDPTHVGRPWTPQALVRLATGLGCDPIMSRHDSSWLARLLLPPYMLGAMVRGRSDIFEWAIWRAVGWASYLVMRKPTTSQGRPVFVYRVGPAGGGGEERD